MVINHASGPLCYFQSICGIRAFFLHYYFDVDARSTFSTHHSVPLLLTMIIGATVSPVLAHRLSRCRTFQSNNSCDALCAVRVSFVFTEECSCCCYSSGFFSAVHSCPPEECVHFVPPPPSLVFFGFFLGTTTRFEKIGGEMCSP